MSVLQNNPFLLASGSPTDPTFPVQRSVRLRSSASAYFNRTPASAGNRTTWTWSAWIKRGTLSTEDWLFSASVGASLDAGIVITATDTLGLILNGNVYNKYTTAIFRDPSAWYHIVVVLDTSNVTAANRIRFYVNGVEQTTYTTQNSGLPTLSYTPPALNNNNLTTLGGMSGYGTSYFDGYLTEINFIDGQALTPLSFGGYNPGTGVWEPRKYSGTYGTNGFYLNFQDNSGATATTIGKDSSGNGNNWTPNNISVTAGATYDSMLDVPTNTSPTNANFATLSPIAAFATGNSFTLSNGNLTYTQATCTNPTHCGSTFALPYGSGLFYYEVNQISKTLVGGDATLPFDLFVKDYAAAGTTYTNAYYYMQGSNGNVFDPAGTLLGSFGAIANGDLIMIALDLVSGKLYLGKNGTWFNSGNPAAGTGAITSGLSSYPVFIPAIGNNGGNMTNFQCAINFGQRPFTYTPPTGFKSLNTYNLPDPTIPSGDDYHKVYTYTGNGGGLQVGEIQKPLSLFNLDRSLRFRSNGSAYLSRTPASAGNRKTWTWSGWVKRGALGVNLSIMGAQANGNSNTQRLNLFWQATTDTLCINDEQINISTNFALVTTRTFKDPSKWYHILVLVDTTQATSSNRLKLYIDGVQETVFSTAVYPSLNFDSAMNNTVAHYHGYYNNLGTTIFYNDGYLADTYFIDGQALTPTDFGTYDGNFYWTPKAYTGTYGTNGFHLEFEDFSASTAAAIGKDTSGQGNNWTPSAGINLTTPEVDNEYWDSYTDVPTLTNTDTANYCTLDPLQVSSTGLRNGNLTVVWTTASSAFKQRGTYTLNTGKWYFEGNIETFTIGNAGNTNYAIGFITTAAGVDTHVSFGWTTNGTSMKLGYRYDVAGVVVQNVTYNTVTPVSTDIFGIEYDVDNGTANFYKNGTLMGSASGLALGEVNPQIWRTGTSNSATMHVNFGQRAFKYTPSTGYKKINAFNVAEVTGDLESPDFVWIKSRSATNDHALFNSVIGVGRYLKSNSTLAEATDVNSLIQFNKNGFLIGNSTAINTSAATYVAAAWKAGATTVTNTTGTGTSSVRANQNSGFSIVTMTNIPTSAGTNTYGHGLNNTPKLIIFKNKDLSDGWYVYSETLGNTAYIRLESTAIQVTASPIWGSASPTPSVFTLRNNSLNTTTGQTILAYCFADIAGFSKFGSYLSNNAADGPFVYTGFRPRWLVVKRAIANTGQTGGWFMYDAARNTYNVMDKYLFAEGTAGDNTLAVFDFTANGFKIRSNNVHVNTTAGDTYIYMAFAENPFKYALAR
jgi:hypothetical protein